MDLGSIPYAAGELEVVQILGLIFLALMVFCRRVALSNWGKWNKALSPVNPSLAPSQSPLDGTINGVTGCGLALVFQPVAIILLVMSLDWIFTKATLTVAVFQLLFG